MLEMNQERDEAEVSYRKALDIDHHCELAANRLGMLYFAREAYPAAAEIFRHAVQLNARQEYRWNLGWSLRQAGRVEEAREAMNGIPREVQMYTDMVMPPQIQPEARAVAAAR